MVFATTFKILEEANIQTPRYYFVVENFIPPIKNTLMRTKINYTRSGAGKTRGRSVGLLDQFGEEIQAPSQTKG